MSNELHDTVTTEEEVVKQEETEAKVEQETAEPVAESTVENTTKTQEVETPKEEEKVEEIDYSALSKEELVAVSQSLLDETDFRKIDEVLRNLKGQFDSRNQALREEALKAFVAGGGDAGDFKYTQDKETDKFYDNYKALKERKHKHFENIEKEKAKNLALKNQIVAQVRELTEQDITKECKS